MTLLQSILRAALLALGCAVLGALLVLLIHLNRDERHFASRADYALDNVNRLVRESAQTVANVRHATGVWEKSSQSQAEATNRAMGQLNTDLVAFGTLVDHTDASLNKEIAPKLEQALDQLKETSVSLNSDAKRLGPILDFTTEAAKNAARLSADPAIPETLHHLDETAAHVEKATQDVQTYIHRLTQPARSLWSVLKGALNLASKAAVLPW